MGTGIPKAAKKVGKAVFGAVKKTGKAIGNAGEAVVDAVDPAEIAARTIDKTVDKLKNDEFVIELFGFKVGRAYVADKE